MLFGPTLTPYHEIGPLSDVLQKYNFKRSTSLILYVKTAHSFMILVLTTDR